MKTKLIIIIACTFLGLSKVMAQTCYYNTTKTFYEIGYTYKCDLVESYNEVTLYNANNIFTYKDMCYPDGRVFSYNGRNSTMEVDTWTKPKCFSIVNNAFSPVEKGRVLGEKLTVVLIMSPQTGKVIEVKFRFMKESPLATIPVSVYRQMELKFKSDIWFVPTAEGKKLNYIMRGWVHDIE